MSFAQVLLSAPLLLALPYSADNDVAADALAFSLRELVNYVVTNEAADTPVLDLCVQFRCACLYDARGSERAAFTPEPSLDTNPFVVVRRMLRCARRLGEHRIEAFAEHQVGVRKVT